jgi:hypothetical protein
MLYVTCRYHGMQIHKFGVTCPGTLFMETTPGPPDHEKEFVDMSCPGRTGIHDVTHRSHRIQKHKFFIMCPSSLFMETATGPPEHEI